MVDRRHRDHRHGGRRRSPDYYSFDAFDEVNFSTGGNMIATGMGIGIVTKRGTNAFGTASGYFTHDDLQWSNARTSWWATRACRAARPTTCSRSRT